MRQFIVSGCDLFLLSLQPHDFDRRHDKGDADDQNEDKQRHPHVVDLDLPLARHFFFLSGNFQSFAAYVLRLLDIDHTVILFKLMQPALFRHAFPFCLALFMKQPVLSFPSPGR